jgi:hypothetical protein
MGNRYIVVLLLLACGGIAAVEVTALRPQDNAAGDWRRGFALLPRSDHPVWVLSQDPEGNLPDADADAEFAKPTGAVDHLVSGAAKPGCDWGIAFQIDVPLPHVEQMRQLMRLGLLRVQWRVARGELAAALDDALHCARAARLFCGRNACLLERATGQGMESAAITAIAAFALRLDAPARQRVVEAFRDSSDPGRLAAALRLDSGMMLAALREEGAKPAAARSAGLAAILGSLPAEAVGPLLAGYQAGVDRRLAILAGPPAGRLAGIEASLDPRLAKLLRALDLVISADTRLVVRRDQLVASMRILAEGELVAETWKNPMTGEPYRMRREGAGFRLDAVPGIFANVVIGGRAPLPDDVF